MARPGTRMRMKILVVRALLNLHGSYGDEFKVKRPTGSGTMMTFAGSGPLRHALSGAHLPPR